ncbi:MAG: hypothetical protein IJ746_00400 [Ruminococcus sp.]|nr:hypothetical protein [Ruminococcus sp.]
MDKLFMVKPEDRPEGALITVTVLLGMALAGVFFYSMFNYNNVTKFIFFLSLLLLYAGLGLACFSVLAKNEAFVVFRDLSMLCVLVCAVLQFAAALDAPVGDGLGFFFRTLSVLKHFVFIIARRGCSL